MYLVVQDTPDTHREVDNLVDHMAADIQVAHIVGEDTDMAHNPAVAERPKAAEEAAEGCPEGAVELPEVARLGAAVVELFLGP